MEHGRGERPLDERTVRDELEQLQEQIEQSRAHRAALQQQFDSFLRRFDPPEVPESREASSGDVPLPYSGTAPGENTPGLPAESGHPEVFAAPVPPSQALPRHAGARSRRSRLVIGSAALLLAGGAATWALRSRTPAAAPAPTHTSAPAPAPAPPPAPTPEPAASTETAILAERAVWMRVLVDGERVVEREVPAGTHLPLEARESIAIRAGNAGAVRVWIRGEDQGLLGREGEVVTRTFRMPAR